MKVLPSQKENNRKKHVEALVIFKQKPARSCSCLFLSLLKGGQWGAGLRHGEQVPNCVGVRPVGKQAVGRECQFCFSQPWSEAGLHSPAGASQCARHPRNRRAGHSEVGGSPLAGRSCDKGSREQKCLGPFSALWPLAWT